MPWNAPWGGGRVGGARRLWTWAAMGVLGVALASGTFTTIVLVFLALFDPMGGWQAPRITHAAITQVCRDTDGRITGQVLGEEEGRDRAYFFSREEALALEGKDEAWVLYHYRSEGTRPSHFRLTPWRLALEYPFPWMALVAWGLWRLRRRQVAEAQAPRDPALPRKVWKDEFHARADRFAAPKPPPEPPL